MSALQTVRTRLLDAAAATGDGQIFQNVIPFFAVALQLEITGSPTAVVVSLKGLIDGSTYDVLAVLDTSAGYISGEIVMLQLPVPVRTLKCSLDTLTGGTNPTVSAYFAGSM